MKSTFRREFFRYVLPSMLAFALSGIYSIADGFFVGNELGDNALAAVNMAYPLTALIQAMGTGIGMGGAIMYTITANSSSPENKKKYFGASLILLGIFSVLLTVLVFFLSPYILKLFGAKGDIYTLGREYIRWIAVGTIFQMLGTGLVPFLRNMGGSVSAMIAMIAGFVTNIFLDYLFVWVFSWGMTGAAIATVIGQAVTFAVCLIYLIMKKLAPSLKLGKEAMHFLKKTFLLGLSPFGLTFSPNITLILINRSAANFSQFAVTCYATVSYISCIVLLLLQGISDGSQPLMSKSYGEGDEAGAKRTRNFGFIVAFVTALVCLILLFFVRGQTAKLFGASAEVGKEVADIMPIFTVGYLFASISRMVTAYFYATEKTYRAYLLIYGEPIILLIFLLFMPSLWGITGTWVAVPASQFVIMLLSILLTYITDKKAKKAAPLPSQHNG